MANVYDQFDAAPAKNVYDQFDAPISTMEDLKSLAPDLLPRAAAATLGLPGDILDLIGRGGTMWTSEDWRKRLGEDILERPLYDPQSNVGKLTNAVAENALGVITPGGLIPKALGVIAPGLGGEGARQAAEAAGLGPTGQAAAGFTGALTSGIGAAKATAGKAAAQQAKALEQAAKVTPAELMAEGAAGKQAAAASQVAINPSDVVNYVARARNELAKNSMPRSLASGTHGTLDELEASAKQAMASGQPLSANDMIGFRGTLTAWQKTPTPNSAAAGAAKSSFDDWLKQTAPTLGQQMEEFTGNFRGGFLGTEIASPANRAALGASAANSGMNTENRIRQAFSTRLAKEDERAMLGRAQRFTPETQGLMRDVVTEGAGNKRRMLGNMFGGGGGLGAWMPTLVGAGTSLASGNIMPMLMAPLPLAGMAIKRSGNKAVLAQADKVAQSAMASSPLAQARVQAVEAQLKAAREAILSSKLSASRKAAMLQALQQRFGQVGNTVGAEENQ